MSYVDYLARQREGYTSVWLEFVQAYQPSGPEIYVFFEGHDDCSFYMPELRRRAADTIGIRPFVCRGKSTVLRLRPSVRRRLNKPWRALFFLDKDLDDILGVNRPGDDPFVFETRFYAIENYLVDETMLAVAWTELLHLPPGSLLVDLLLRFRRDLARFQRHLLVLMAWVLFHRKRKQKPNLNNVSLDDLFDRSNPMAWRRDVSRIEVLDRLAGTRTRCPCWRGIRAALRLFGETDLKLYVRGHFELWFFVRFLEMALQLTRTSVPEGATRVTMKNAVTVLAARLVPPKEVSEFMDGVWAAIAADPLSV